MTEDGLETKDSGCNVCGTILQSEDPDQPLTFAPFGYLNFETEMGTQGVVCSWVCAATFALRALGAKPSPPKFGFLAPNLSGSDKLLATAIRQYSHHKSG